MDERMITANTYPHLSGGIFVSDLHLFCPRHQASGIVEELSSFREAEQCIVLGGDIFDFRWSDRGSLEESLSEATSWLRELLSSCGAAQVFYLLGNHDCHPDYVSRLQELDNEYPNFSWHPHHIHLNDSLFLHGDILDAQLDLTRLATYREQFHEAQPKAKLLQRSYDAAIALRLHKLLVQFRNHPSTICPRLLHVIGQEAELPDSSAVKRVFFGHTHFYCEGLNLDGVRFYNPGAALRHIKFKAHQFTLRDETEHE